MAWRVHLPWKEQVLKHVKLLVVFALAVSAIATAAPAAFGQTAKGYEQWAGCPNLTTVFFCIRTETNSGHIQIGGTDTPIDKQIVLSGGFDAATGKLAFTSQGGLVAPPLRVPGGLTGLTGLSEFLIDLITFGAHEVYAQAILVGDPTSSVVGLIDKLDVTLPVRVKLINPFLKSTCSIGSASTPLTFNLTTGTTAPPLPNKPISGVINPLAPIPGLQALQSSNDTLVDNAFAAPVASGCDLIGFGLINALVNARVGLPSAAGKNTAIFGSSTVKLAPRGVVYP